MKRCKCEEHVKIKYVFSAPLVTIKDVIWHCAVLQFPATASVHAVDISKATFMALKDQGVEEITQEQHYARWTGKAAVR